jgi:hypothetical protein
MQGLSVVVGIRWRSKISSSGVLYTDFGTRAHRLVTCRDRAGPSHHCDHWTWRIVVVLGRMLTLHASFFFRSDSPMDSYFLTPILNRACTSYSFQSILQPLHQAPSQAVRLS